MQPPKPHTRDDLETLNKMLTRALDRTLPEGDAVKAGTEAVIKMRLHGIRIESLIATEMGTEAKHDPAAGESGSFPVDRPHDDPGLVIMSFGKFKGHALAHVAEQDPDYLKWLANDATIENSRVAEAVEAVYVRTKQSGK